MKIKSLVFAIMAAGLGVAGPALAHPHGQRGEHEWHGGGWQHGRYGGWDRHAYWRDHAGRGYYYDRGYAGRYPHHHVRGVGPYYDLWIGDPLPAAYWGPRYRIIDWRRARLGPPMYGCEWVRVGTDYVQVSVSTGMITAVWQGPW